MRILFVGVGFVATVAAESLAARGHEVFGLRRSERPLPSSIHARRGDVTTGEGFASLPDDFDRIVYAVSPGERSESAYEAAYPRGVARVIARWPEARLLLVSSTAVYGAATAEIIDENTPPEPNDATSRKLVEAEELVTQANGVVLRASGIYGPGRTRLVQRLVRDPPRGDERNVVTNRIHRDDLARALEFFVERDHGGTYVASDEHPATLGEMADWLHSRSLPATWLEAPNERATNERARSSRFLSSARLRGLGFSFRYPTFREGYAALIESELADARSR